MCVLCGQQQEMDRTGIGLLLVCLLCVSPCVLGQDMVNVAANAPGRTCRQSSFYQSRDVACNAANGNTGGTYPVTGASANCIHTAATGYYYSNRQYVEDRTPWWEVDLGREYPVQDITVWGRDVETNRLYPFNITVDGKQCARAVSGGREISVTCDTVIHGQKVRLTRDYKYGSDYSLNMCELEVWVCQSGYHRVSNKICELCNTNCDRGCDRNNGRCDGCKLGYHGDQCDSQCSSIHNRCTQCTQDSTCTACSNYFQSPACTVCQSGYHKVRDTCVQCSTNCDNRGCGGTNGKCHGCKEFKYRGDQCNDPCSTINGKCIQCTQGGICTACSDILQPPSCTVCQSGYHKLSSNTCQQCGTNCDFSDTRRCDRTNGRCYGCKFGYHGDQCNSQCSTINSRCTQCTQDSTCTTCSSNFQPEGCTDCALEYYKSGNLCSRCSVNCKNRRCDSNTGRCDGCNDGRYGNTCDPTCGDGCTRCDQDSGNCTACTANTNLKFPGCTECEDGYYGYSPRSSSCTGCKGRCYNNTPCNKTTGHCLECPPGKKGNLCSVACDAGKYGLRCALPCGHCQGGGACDPESGTCPLCHPGYYPPTCQDACRDKTYGQNCSESCGHCKGGQPCNTTTGECTDGCEPGYIDAVCKTQCDAGLYGDRCNETCGHCQVNTTCHHEDGHCLEECVTEFTGPMCSQATSQENKDDGATNLVGPIVGSIVGVGLVMTISVTAAICWRRKSATSRSSVQDPPTASSISVKDAAPTVSPEPSPLRQSSSNEDNLYSEIRDPDDTYEISEMQSIYDKPSPYSNDDGDREPYMQLTLKTHDVNMPASNAAYVNTKLSV